MKFNAIGQTTMHHTIIVRMILPYKILEIFGEGSMAVVYRAVDTILRREVAIKSLPRQIARSAEKRARFMNEARAAAAARRDESAPEIIDRDHTMWGNLAAAYDLIPGQHEKALQAYRQAIRLADSQRKINPRDLQLLSRLGGNMPAWERKKMPWPGSSDHWRSLHPPSM